MNAPDDLSSLSNEHLQEVVHHMRAELLFKQAYIEKLTHENAYHQATEVRGQV